MVFNEIIVFIKVAKIALPIAIRIQLIRIGSVRAVIHIILDAILVAVIDISNYSKQ